MNMMAKALDKNTMITRSLLKMSVESRQGKPRDAEGQEWDRAQESEGSEVRPVHSTGRGDGKVVPDEGQESTEKEDLMQKAQVPDFRVRAPRYQHPRVNVAVEDACEHPGQDKRSLRVEHTIEKMAQQVNIISGVEVVKVVDLFGETEGAMNVMIYMLCMYMMYRQKKVKKFKKKLVEVTSPGFVKRLRGLVDINSSSAFSFTRVDAGVYHWPSGGPDDRQDLWEHTVGHDETQSGC